MKNMRYSTEHKQETRNKILEAAAQQFRANGYDGQGVDGLAKAAGVTNGAFYGHFASKAEAFETVVGSGLDDLRKGLEQYRDEDGADWIAAFADFYFSEMKVQSVENVCALPAFAHDMIRASNEARKTFEAKLLDVLSTASTGLPPGSVPADDRAWIMLSLFVGGVTLARAVPDRTVSDHIAEVVREAVKSFAGPKPQQAPD
jgi:TetR/AcrR family transcriptional regulator, transcriptional repressor for nem operon